jgi:hypothetical protein
LSARCAEQERADPLTEPAQQQAFDIRTAGDLGRNTYFRAAQAWRTWPSPPERPADRVPWVG